MLRYVVEVGAKAEPTWGFAFEIQPFEHVRWKGDSDVLTGSCFDWDCFAFDLGMRIAADCKQVDTDFFYNMACNLIDYLNTAGMPFKSQVVELLIKLHGFRDSLLTKVPDVK